MEKKKTNFINRSPFLQRLNWIYIVQFIIIILTAEFIQNKKKDSLNNKFSIFITGKKLHSFNSICSVKARKIARSKINKKTLLYSNWFRSTTLFPNFSCFFIDILVIFWNFVFFHMIHAYNSLQ